MKFRRLFAVIACAALLSVAASARADDVKTDYNHHADFASFHTYCWEKVEVANQLVANRVQRAIDRQLQSKGWQQGTDNCQITVYVKGEVKNEKQLETYYDGMGGGWGGGWGWGGWGWGPGGGFGMSTSTVNNMPEGHLVVDMFDNQSKQLVWRGISQREISNNPDKNRKMVYQDLDDMFKKFPPKK